MRYDFRCTNAECDNLQEDDCSMTEFKDHHPTCELCGALCNYEYTPTVPQIAFKDGPSGSWPSKGERFKKYRAEASAAASRRQRDHYGEPKGVVPNYGGKETENWREAQSLAMRERGMESAATYNDKVQQEIAADTTIKVCG